MMMRLGERAETILIGLAFLAAAIGVANGYVAISNPNPANNTAFSAGADSFTLTVSTNETATCTYSETYGFSTNIGENRTNIIGFGSSDEAVTLDINGGTNGQADFYNANEGLFFSNVSYEFESADGHGLLDDGLFENIQSSFSGVTPSAAPIHTMRTRLSLDGRENNLIWYEKGLGSDDKETLTLEIDKNDIRYSINTGEIPLSTIIRNGTIVDTEYRGLMPFFGEEYYVTDIATDEMYLAQGTILTISSSDYIVEYQGYAFKLNDTVAENGTIIGLLVDVQRPTNPPARLRANATAATVDNLSVMGINISADNTTAAIRVADLTTLIHLEDGGDLILPEGLKQYWRATFEVETYAADLSLSEYNQSTGAWLKNISLIYRHDIELESGESLLFPREHVLRFTGFANSTYEATTCSGGATDNITIAKDGAYQLLVNLTSDDGTFLFNVRLDQGPFITGDRFMLSGKVYRMVDVVERNDDITLNLTLEDLTDGGNVTYALSATSWTGGSAGGTKVFWTIPFVEEDENNETIEIEADAFQADSGVYVGALGSVNAVYDNGDLYLDVTETELNDSGVSRIGVSPTQLGTFADFEGTRALTMWAIAEDGMTNINSVAEPMGEGNDILLVLQNADAEVFIVDFYDRDFDRYYDVEHYTNVIAADTYPSNSSDYLTSSEVGAYLNDDRDTQLWLPEGGDHLTARYGVDEEIMSVNLCHPRQDVDVAIYLGARYPDNETTFTFTHDTLHTIQIPLNDSEDEHDYYLTCTNAARQSNSPKYHLHYTQVTTTSTISTTTSTSTTSSSTSTTTTIPAGPSQTYRNLPCEYCETPYNGTPDITVTTHAMQETYVIDNESISYNGTAASINASAVRYVLDTDHIPLDIVERFGNGTYADFEWRGKCLFLGGEYYARDYNGSAFILNEADIVENVSNGTWQGNVSGYQFRLNSLVYPGDWSTIAGIIVDIQKPDASIVQRQISTTSNGAVDTLRIGAINASNESGQHAALIVYNSSAGAVLENGKNLTLDGSVQENWQVSLTTVAANETDTGKPAYDNATSGTFLANITITYTASIQLDMGDSFEYPSLYSLSTDGSSLTIDSYYGTETLGESQQTVSLNNGWNLVSLRLTP